MQGFGKAPKSATDLINTSERPQILISEEDEDFLETTLIAPQDLIIVRGNAYDSRTFAPQIMRFQG